MAWIGITDHQGGWFSLNGPNRPHPRHGVRHDTLLPRGSLVVETRLSSDNRPQTLLSFQRAHPWPGSFSLQALPNGSIILIDAQGDDVRHGVLPCPYDDRTEIIRLTYSWDAPRGWGQLTMERPDANVVQSIEWKKPRPVLLEDMEAIMTRPFCREIDSHVIFAAVSDRVEPVGPMPGLTSRTPIMTQSGEKPISTIRRGDVVITEQREAVPVLQVVRRVVPARGSFQPIRLHARYFGLHNDIVVAPHQALIIAGSQVEYTFNKEAVLVPARQLVNNVSAWFAKGPELVEYYQLLLAEHEGIIAAGCPVESLFVGRIRRKQDALANSILAPFDRARLPEHAKPIWPVLKPFEAITLAQNRMA